MGDDVISGEKAPLWRITSGCACAHPREPTFGYWVTFHNVTSGQKDPLGRILRSFRLRSHNQGNTLLGHVTSGSPVGHAQWHILYYFSQSQLFGHSRYPTNNLVCIRRINRTFQLHESLIKLYFKQFSIFHLFSWIKVKVLISFAWLDFS